MFENLSRIRRIREENGERGFTLIELLIVIVVLGILAAIVVFALGGVTGQSAVASCTSDAKTVSIAVSAYNAQTGNYPAQNGGTVTTLAQQEALLVPTYLKSWPSNAAYYNVGLSTDGKAVTVYLPSTVGQVPGNATTAGTPAAATAAPGSLFEADGATAAFTYGATGATTGASTNLQGLGICAGV